MVLVRKVRLMRRAVVFSKEGVVELRIDHTKNIAYIKLTGLLSSGLIIDAFDASVADASYRPGMARLWDFRDADLSSLDTTTIAMLAQHSTRFPPGINDVKVAFVAGRELEFGLARMFEAFSEDADTKISVHYSLGEAEEWLAE
jgi:hypothetical protein